ncbi:MAG TPA: DoxX family protein [Candidatus Dormibacteraeota bacterium]|nr:DoxX family protein [Candidatus Dormibacteraeota bacterium]
MQFLDKLKPLGLLVLRAVLGASFIYHGLPKLNNTAHVMKVFTGYGFPSYFVYISGILEVFGGGLLLAGLFTRGVALLLAIEMGVVLGQVKFPSTGIYAYGQYELPLLLGAMALALVTTGAGVISIDAFTFESRRKTTKKSKSKD